MTNTCCLYLKLIHEYLGAQMSAIMRIQNTPDANDSDVDTNETDLKEDLEEGNDC